VGWLFLTVVVFHLLGFLSSLHLASGSRGRRAPVVWTAFLIAVPYLAVPLYWLVGRSLEDSFQRDLGNDRDELQDRQDHVRAFLECHRPENAERYLAPNKLSSLPLTTGNAVKILADAQETFSTLYRAIGQAEEVVVVQFYQIQQDEAGQTFKENLIRAAKRGVRVYLLYDPLESSVDESYCQDLRNNGVRIAVHRPTRKTLNPANLNNRNHRKIVVVDGRFAYLGGFNVGDQYLSRVPELAPWLDTFFEIRGPMVLAAQLTFLRDFHHFADEVPNLPWDNYDRDAGDCTLGLIASGPNDTHNAGGLAFMEMIGSARKSIWLTTPFLAPDEGAVAAIEIARLRGVEVNILLPGQSEVAVGDLVAWHFIARLLPKGVRFFKKSEGSMHQKLLLVDDDLSLFGSANFDFRSFHLNYEVMVYCESRNLNKRLKNMLESELEEFVEVKESELNDRGRLAWLKTTAARTLDLMLGG
jgi:cardiolipin synthase A/B